MRAYVDGAVVVTIGAPDETRVSVVTEEWACWVTVEVFR